MKIGKGFLKDGDRKILKFLLEERKKDLAREEAKVARWPKNNALFSA